MNVKKMQNVRQPVSLLHFTAMPKNPAEKNHRKYLDFLQRRRTSGPQFKMKIFGHMLNTRS